jgi:hypothetical protein
MVGMGMHGDRHVRARTERGSVQRRLDLVITSDVATILQHTLLQVVCDS